MRISDWSSDVCSSDLLAVHFDATVLVQLDGVRFEPRRRARPKTECDNDAIRRNDLFRARHDLRLATTARVGRAKRGGDDLHAARKRVVYGKSVSVRVDLGGRRILRNKKTPHSD